MLKVYVAGAWIERKERAIPAIQALRAAGVIITHDWTVDEDQHSNAVVSDSHMPNELRLKRAQDDFNGVLAADVVLILTPHERGASGMWTEFGIALGTGKRIYIAGENSRRTIFTELPQCAHFATDAMAIATLTVHVRK